MIIAFAVFPYLIGGIVMWFVAHQVAPVGYNISLTRGVCAVAIMSCGSAIANYFLRPMMGDWSYAAEFVVSVLLGMVILRLTFWRTLLVVVVYWIVFVVALVVIAIIFKAQGNARPTASLHPDGDVSHAFLIKLASKRLASSVSHIGFGRLNIRTASYIIC
jgi:hypothetical protein